MRFCSPKRLWLALLLLTVAAGGVRGQWRIVAPKALQGISEYGAMHFNEGIIWAGTNDLIFSEDTGRTWTSLTFGQTVCDIAFTNKINGVIATTDGIFRTMDGGNTWTQFSPFGFFDRVSYGNSDQIIYCMNDGGDVFISLDGGTSWKQSDTGGDGEALTKAIDGTIYVLAGASTTNSHVFSCNDTGHTWHVTGGDVAYDCYSIDVDSCDASKLYVPHEGIAAHNFPDQLFVSSDQGASWTVVLSYSQGNLTGSFTSSHHAQYAGTLNNGLLRSTDHGMTWVNIGGPDIAWDSRNICAISDNIVFALDEQGNVWATFNSGGDSIKVPQSTSANNTLFIPSQSSILNQSLCNTPVDTSIPLGITGCGTLTGTLDSLWLTGSSAFLIADSRTSPRSLATVDSILVSYNGTQGTDTAVLHLQYNIGSGVQDTTIQLIGTASFSAQTAQLHREAASAYFGQIDSLTLAVDLSSQINIDSLWPYITEIQATFSWDSSVVSEYGYIQPPGWALKSLSSNGNSESFVIQNKSSVATQPLDLGTALFLPDSTQLASGWVELPSLVINIGSQQLSLCVTDNEDNHWSVKTLGVQSGVTEVPLISQDISIYPNPAGDELFIQNPNEFSLSIELYDAIGREVLSATGAPASTTTIATQSLQDGVYFFRASNGAGFSTSNKLVIVR